MRLVTGMAKDGQIIGGKDRHNKRWTVAEDDYVKANYRKIPTEEMECVLGRTSHAIEMRASNLRASGKRRASIKNVGLIRRFLRWLW